MGNAYEAFAIVWRSLNNDDRCHNFKRVARMVCSMIVARGDSTSTIRDVLPKLSSVSINTIAKLPAEEREEGCAFACEMIRRFGVHMEHGDNPEEAPSINRICDLIRNLEPRKTPQDVTAIIESVIRYCPTMSSIGLLWRNYPEIAVAQLPLAGQMYLLSFLSSHDEHMRVKECELQARIALDHDNTQRCATLKEFESLRYDKRKRVDACAAADSMHAIGRTIAHTIRGWNDGLKKSRLH